MPRPYRLGRREPAVERTAATILQAARQLVAERGGSVSVAELARRAGVSRATVYNRFGSRSAVMASLRPAPAPPAAGEDLWTFIQRSCAAWAAAPPLYRHLGTVTGAESDTPRRIAAELAAADGLRPGCSLREAEDVITVLTSFPVFDRLHGEGRRSVAAVAAIIERLAQGILA
jgi:AcrR family transcriptional regulator